MVLRMEFDAWDALASSAGAQHSQSPVEAVHGGGDGAIILRRNIDPLFNLAHLRKMIHRELTNWDPCVIQIKTIAVKCGRYPRGVLV